VRAIEAPHRHSASLRGLAKPDLAIALLLVCACTEPLAERNAQITTAVKHERYGLIRDSAAEMGMHNAALMAGIATSETALAHCQSEATYACMGPASSSCGGGPIIAGAADGPCTAMQGGLGMFQFDAGTYTQTLALYGDSILTIEGNTAQAVSYVADRVQMHIAGIDDWLSAMAWLDAIPMDAADPKMDEWARFIVCRYNGCCTATSTTCQMRAVGYRDNAIKAYGDMGAEFWRTDNRCVRLPPDGVIDQRSECYLAAGDPRFWHRETGGLDDDREWTGTNNAAAPSNFARWIVKSEGVHSIEVHLDGGQFGSSTRAAYTIVHAGATDVVVIDQAAASGWVSLGDFEFAGEGDEYIMLGDNTGEPAAMDRTLVFDAVRVTSLDGGCCSSTRGSGTTAIAGGLLVMVVLRRRRSSPRAPRAPRA
jgi:hypothetical protein